MNLIQNYNYFQQKYPQAQFLNLGSHYIPLELTGIKNLQSPLQTAFLYAKGGLKVSGSESAAFLQGLMSADIKKLNSDKTLIPSFFSDNRGHILFDCWVKYIAKDSYLIFCEPNQEQSLSEHLNFYLITEDCQLEILPEKYLWFFFFEKEPKNIAFDFKAPNLGVNSPETISQQTILDNFQLIGINEFEQLRPIFNWPRSGVDYNNKNYPLESGLADWVSYTKGCYIGQETIARMFNKGRATKKIMRFRHKNILTLPSNIMFNDSQVGKITSTSSLKFANNFFSLGVCKTSILEEIAENSLKTAPSNIEIYLAPELNG